MNKTGKKNRAGDKAGGVVDDMGKGKEYLEDSMSSKTHIRGRKNMRNGGGKQDKNKIMLEGRKK